VGSNFHSWSILVQRFGKPLKISVVVCTLRSLAVECPGETAAPGGCNHVDSTTVDNEGSIDEASALVSKSTATIATASAATTQIRASKGP